MWRLSTSLRCGLFVAYLLVEIAACGAGEPDAAVLDRDRVAELEQSVARLQRQLDALQTSAGAAESPAVPPAPATEVFADDSPPATPEWLTPATHGVVYDKGWTLRPLDPQRMPYELTVSFHNQFRYTGFAAEESSYVNSAGQTVATPERSDFDINRGRLIFSGYAIDPMIEFYMNVDYNTVADQPIQMLMAWIKHPLHPAFRLAYGLGKVPGSWEWQESARYTLGAERSLATTFFRPSMTAGIWADGELLPGLHFHTLLGNGFNTYSLNASQLDTNLASSGMLWWEPLGPFGAGFSDLERHREPVVRVGQAFTFSRQDADPVGEPGPEQTVVRLSDGTRLVETGALAPGVTVNQFDLSLYALHAGVKSQGASLSGEYFFRWLNELQADGPLPTDSIFDHGFYLQGGYFVVPEKLELFGRGSAVFGPYGDGSELGGGANFYPLKRRDWRFTVDMARVNHSPAQQDRTGFEAGGSGLLVRMQVWTFF